MKTITPLLLLIALLTACGAERKTRGETAGEREIPLRHAAHLALSETDDCTIARLRNPWDTTRLLHTYLLVGKDRPLPRHIPDGATVVRTPLTCAVVYSAIHCSLLGQLGALGSIGGVCDLDYIQLPDVRRGCREGNIADAGSSLNPDIERIIDLHPDAILLSPFENSGGYGRIGQLGIPLVECAEYMETSPLGMAEWMRFYGRLVGQAPRADSLFAHVEQTYRELSRRALAQAERPRVISELKNGAAWYVPGGRSTVARAIADAGGSYVFADDPHTGAVPLAFETVFERGGEADIWLIKYHQPADKTYRELAADYAPYAGFAAFRRRHIYGCNTARIPFYEESPFRPDRLLADLIRILHPAADGGEAHYYSPLDE